VSSKGKPTFLSAEEGSETLMLHPVSVKSAVLAAASLSQFSFTGVKFRMPFVPKHSPLPTRFTSTQSASLTYTDQITLLVLKPEQINASNLILLPTTTSRCGAACRFCGEYVAFLFHADISQHLSG
jgi:hypothetical protein